jgi:hypothetical protein
LSAVTEHGTFVSYSAADWREAAGERPPFVVDGVIAKGVTLVYGQSEAGKSMLISGALAALVRGEESFLNRSVEQRDWSPGLLIGDFDDGRRYGQRLENAGLTPAEMGRINFYDPTKVGMPWGDWAALAEVFRERGHNVLVVDTLSAFVPGDINQGPPCAAFFDALVQFTAQDIAVIVSAHSTEKYSQFGTQDFIGHSAIRQRPSWHCKVYKVDDNRKRLAFHGNDGGKHDIAVSMLDAAAPVFKVTAERDSGEIDTDKAERSRNRSGSRKSKSDQVRDYVLSQCQGLNRNQTAAKVAAKFSREESPLKETTVRSNLSRGSYGVRLGADGRSWATAK